MASKAQDLKYVILNRTRLDCIRIAPDFEALGFYPCFFPLIESVTRKLPSVDFSEFDAVIMTSQKALPSFYQADIPRSMQIFCVGEKMKEHLMEVGYSNVVVQPTAGELEPVIMRSHLKNLVYLSGDEVKIPMHANLRAKGFDVTRHVVYLINPVPLDLEELKNKIAAGGEVYFPFYSLRTLKFFSQQIMNSELDLKKCAAICISDDLKWLAGQVGFGKVIVAKWPAHDGILEAFRDEC